MTKTPLFVRLQLLEPSPMVMEVYAHRSVKTLTHATILLHLFVRLLLEINYQMLTEESVLQHAIISTIATIQPLIFVKLLLKLLYPTPMEVFAVLPALTKINVTLHLLLYVKNHALIHKSQFIPILGSRSLNKDSDFSLISVTSPTFHRYTVLGKIAIGPIIRILLLIRNPYSSTPVICNE